MDGFERLNRALADGLIGPIDIDAVVKSLKHRLMNDNEQQEENTNYMSAAMTGSEALNEAINAMLRSIGRDDTASLWMVVNGFLSLGIDIGVQLGLRLAETEPMKQD